MANTIRQFKEELNHSDFDTIEEYLAWAKKTEQTFRRPWGVTEYNVEDVKNSIIWNEGIESLNRPPSFLAADFLIN